jgi:hypothetical protein
MTTATPMVSAISSLVKPDLHATAQARLHAIDFYLITAILRVIVDSGVINRYR